MLETIESRKLLENVRTVEGRLVKALGSIWDRKNGSIKNVRGKGNMIAFDYEATKELDLHKVLRERGINTGKLV